MAVARSLLRRAALALVLCAPLPVAAHAGTLPDRRLCRVTPAVIEAGAFYDGADIKLEGVAAPRSQVVVTVSGSGREERFNQQARFGPIWLNARKVRISGAPSLFLRYRSGPPGSLEGEGCGRTGRWDEGSIADGIRIEPLPADAGTAARLRADFVALKKRDELYRFSDTGVRLGEPGPEGVPYTAAFRWPKRAPPARYEIRVYEIVDGAVARETHLPLEVVRSGFPAWLAELAERQAPLYGLSAVLIALVAGFGIDFLTRCVFRGRRSVAH